MNDALDRIIERLTATEEFWRNELAREFAAKRDPNMCRWLGAKERATKAALDIVLEEAGLKEKETTATAVTA